MLDKVSNYIEQKQLIERKDKIVVGVSGGADSVCLFRILLELQNRYELELFVVHLHHGIRGEEADKDETFVKELAADYRIPYFPIWRDIPKLAKEWGSTEEEAGRNARYEAFYQVLKEVRGNKIAVAHNQNDCAETVLFQLFRGSGLKGMGGIAPRRDVIIRPLLSVDRKEIEKYLEQKGQAYCTDHTNLTMDYTRNKIRHALLPIAEKEINEKAVEHIAKTAEFLREAESYIKKNVNIAYETIVTEKKGQYFMELTAFEKEDIVIQKTLIKQILSKAAGKAKDIEARHIEAVLELTKKQSGKQIHLPYHMTVRKEYEFLVLEAGSRKKKTELDGYSYELIPGKTYRIEEAGYTICLEFVKEQIKWEEIPQNTCMKWFDYDKIENGICVRGRRAGDYLQVHADGGTKKLKDYFIDKKIPREQRENMVLLADGSHIIWIFGDRISERYKVTKATQNILKVNIMEEEKNGR